MNTSIFMRFGSIYIFLFCFSLSAMQQQSSLLCSDQLGIAISVDQPEERVSQDVIVMNSHVKEIYMNIAKMSVSDAIRFLFCQKNRVGRCRGSKRLIEDIISQVSAFKIAHDRYLSTLDAPMRALKENAPILTLAIHYMHQDGLCMAKLIVQAFGLQYRDPQRSLSGWLHHAALFGNIPFATWLLEQAQEQNIVMNDFINMRDNNGNTPLDEAVLVQQAPHGDVMVQFLRDHQGVFGRDLDAIVR